MRLNRRPRVGVGVWRDRRRLRRGRKGGWRGRRIDCEDEGAYEGRWNSLAKSAGLAVPLAMYVQYNPVMKNCLIESMEWIATVHRNHESSCYHFNLLLSSSSSRVHETCRKKGNPHILNQGEDQRHKSHPTQQFHAKDHHGQLLLMARHLVVHTPSMHPHHPVEAPQEIRRQQDRNQRTQDQIIPRDELLVGHASRCRGRLVAQVAQMGRFLARRAQVVSQGMRCRFPRPGADGRGNREEARTGQGGDDGLHFHVVGSPIRRPGAHVSGLLGGDEIQGPVRFGSTSMTGAEGVLGNDYG